MLPYLVDAAREFLIPWSNVTYLVGINVNPWLYPIYLVDYKWHFWPNLVYLVDNKCKFDQIWPIWFITNVTFDQILPRSFFKLKYTVYCSHVPQFHSSQFDQFWQKPKKCLVEFFWRQILDRKATKAFQTGNRSSDMFSSRTGSCLNILSCLKTGLRTCFLSKKPV